jgi:hypothetical protein
MTQSQALAGLLVILIPFIAGLLTRATWPSWVRFSVVVVLSLAVGTGTLFYAGLLTFTAGNYLVVTLAIIGASQTIYTYLIRTTGLGPWIDSHLIH